MANIGDGYGSECHLLRWMGRHRKLFDERIANAVGRPGGPIEWLDFNFAPNKPWPDAELKGLEFLYNLAGIKTKWKEFWPTGGGIHNWDAVGWLGAEPHQELLLLEAKAHVGEMKSDCKAESPKSIEKITQAFDNAKEYLGVGRETDWSREYYQAANRITTLHFLHHAQVPARLLFIYFLGDRVPGKECPRTQEGWKDAINDQWEYLGLATAHPLANRVHELFLPISVPLPQPLPT